MDIVDKLSNDISNYLKNKNIPYTTTDELKMVTNKTNSPPKDEEEEDVLSCCDGNVKMERIHINTYVKSISDLLQLCETYELAENVTYNIDMKALHKIYPHLTELNNMIGMPAIKQTIVDQIIYFIQGLHLSATATTATTATTTSGSLPPVHVVKNNKIINNTSPTTGAAIGATTGASFADGLSIAEPMFGPTGAGIATANANINATAKNTKPKDEPITSAIFRFPLFNPSNMSNIFLPHAPKSKPANKNDGVGAGDYMHTVLYGPPGTGKTEVAKILGNIFCNLGILTSNTFKKVTRSDLVAGYLGQTAIKTREVIESAIGGVLFIDEAYALGNTEKRDSFSKECIDTLCEALSDHKHELMVIIAGYEKELNDCFFSYNEGLSSRFTWRYKIENYDSIELRKIFEKIVKDNGWTLAFKFDRDAVKDEWFKSRQQYFKYFGRDIEVFFTKTKIAHARRVFYLPVKDRRSLIMDDLDAGFELFTANEEIKSRGNSLHGGPAATMYL
jgi:chromosomal replication initiation ATPase DnaA